MIIVAIILALLLAGALFYYRRKVNFILNGIRVEKNNSAKKEQTISELKIQIRSYENDLKDKDSLLSAHKANEDDLRHKLKAAEDAMIEIENRFESSSEALKENNKKLSNNLISAGNDINRLNQSIQEKDRVNMDLVEANKALIEKMADLKKQNLSAVSSAGGYEKSNKNLRATVETLTEQYNENVRKYNALAEKYEALEKSHEELEIEYDKVLAILSGPKEDNVDPEEENGVVEEMVDYLVQSHNAKEEEEEEDAPELPPVEELVEEKKEEKPKEPEKVQGVLKQLKKKGKKKKN